MRTVLVSLLLAVAACANPMTTPLFEIGRDIERAGANELAKDAPAIILEDRRTVRHFLQPTHFTVVVNTKIDVYRAIEIRNEAGLGYADVVLAPDNGLAPQAIAAQTILPDGTRVPVDPATIKTLTIEWLGGGSPYQLQILTFPKVTPGAILEYRYFTRHDGLREYDRYEPRSALPVLYAEHLFHTYGLVGARHDARGMRCSTPEVGGRPLSRQIVRCEGRSLAPRRWEAFQTPNAKPDVYSAFIVAQYDVPESEAKEALATWGAASQRLAKALDDARELPPAVIAPHAEAKSTKEKILSVWRAVQHDVRDVDRGYRSHGGLRPVYDIYSHRFGGADERARLIEAMLRELKVDAEILIVANGSSADPTANHVDPTFFSRGDWLVKAGEIYLDPYCEGCPPGELARSHLGRAAISATRGVVRLPSANVTKQPISSHDYQLVLSPRGLVIEDGVQTIRGASAGQVRWYYFNHPLPPSRLRERIEREYLDGIEGGEVGIQGLDTEEGPVRIHFSGTLLTRSGYVHAGDLLMVPVDAVFPNGWMYTFGERRNKDVAFQSAPAFENTFRFAVPDGAKVLARPVATSATSKFGRYDLGWTESGGVVSVKEKLKMTVREIPVEDYDEFFLFIRDVRKARTQKLVLQTPKARATAEPG